MFFLPHTKIVEAKWIIDEQWEREHWGETSYYSKQEIRKMYEYKAIVDSAVHPDTGDFIPWICRISSYVPVSIPVLFGMILSPPTTVNIIFWQWFN